MRTALIAVSMSLVFATPALAQPPQPTSGVAAADVPAALTPAVARAEQAMNTLQSTLLARLKEEMSRGGAEGALRVCHEEAKAIAARLAREQGLALGRTSHALRNPDNAAPAWASATVAGGAGKKASQVGVRVFDLGGGKVGVLRPIGFVETCAACHGPREALAADVKEALEALYPSDRGVGFSPGDLRGWMWAEVPR